MRLFEAGSVKFLDEEVVAKSPISSLRATTVKCFCEEVQIGKEMKQTNLSSLISSPTQSWTIVNGRAVE